MNTSNNREVQAAERITVRIAALPVLLAASCVLTGCSPAAAPSFALFGAYFPAWMLCGVIGIVGAAVTRVVLTTPAFNDVVPYQFAVCAAAGVILALLPWLVLFR